MCDMQKMPSREDDSCDEDSEMNFTAFSTAGPAAGTHFMTTSAQLPVAKLQQNMNANGAALSQVVGMVGGVNMGDGVQYVRTLDGSAALQTPQFITLPIALPGAKPGDPQQTVQIQVLSPNLTLQTQQQPKYQMQIPIQGFQQGGAVLTLAYSPEANDGIQLLGNTLPEGLQVLAALPQEMQLMQPAQAQSQENKDQMATSMPHQVFIQNQQIVMNSGDDKLLNNNNSNNNNNMDISQIIIKEECDEMGHDDESSQGTDGTNDSMWQGNSGQDIVNYLNKLPQQQPQTLPVSLQQFLRLNPVEMKKEADDENIDGKNEDITEAVLSEDGTIRIKKKKKYKKKPPKPTRPKPGQVVIATSNDGTTIFCCPECQMAYPEKEQLELHLSVHKIERRFICGICGAGLKRKEHLERHKLGHNPERPYVCAVCRKGFKRREHLNLHTVIHSGVKTEVCLECGKGFYRKDHLRKHTRSHETKRAREEAMGSGGGGGGGGGGAPTVDLASIMPVIGDSKGLGDAKATGSDTILPEITIHVPTSANVQVPVQINIPQHVVSSLVAQQAGANAGLDALLAHHS